MSRAIKFRTWDKQNDCWFQPTYEAYKGNLEELLISPNGRVALRTTRGMADESTFPGRFVLMQFTNLTDHAGTEIYDKDIVRYTNKRPGNKWRRSHGDRDYNDMIVSWNAKKGGWYLFWKHQATGELCYMSLAKALDANHKVVGNVYENPELAK
jgi:uncharacterized phage protein (TIGR01671 family)